jgi:hypothetical protein
MTGAVRSRFDALRLLGLAADASQRDVRAAFRRLAFATHPDRHAGQEDDFARVREAYEMLRDGGGAEASVARPVRPTVEVRVTLVPDEMQAACRALLDARALAAPGDDMSEPQDGIRHVPFALRRKGRQVTYLVPTSLRKGTNVVAVPVGELDDPRRIAPRIVRVTSNRPGPGVVDLAHDVVEPLFPGARGVSIEFGMV